MVPESEDDKTRQLSADEATQLQTRTLPAGEPTVTLAKVRLPVAGSNRLPVTTRLAEFEITGVIGEGGFGIVYTAYDHSLERDVAIKEYMPSGLAARVDGVTVGVLGEESLETFESGLRSFVNEARLLARFDHPSLLKVYRFWEANGTAYMAMPHYHGETLKQRLRRSGAPEEAWLRTMLMQLLAALEVIHAEQCFHRDIAPDNIFLVEDDRPVLLDFGAARRVISDKTHALTVILKPGFAPVEQYADVPNLKQGAWTDLYALAAVVYHAITGEKPPPSISRYVSDQMVPLSQRAAGRYSPAFLALIDEALSVQPTARPQSAAAMRTLLAGLSAAPQPGAPSVMAASAAPAATAAEDKTVSLPAAASAAATRVEPTVPVPASIPPVTPTVRAVPATAVSPAPERRPITPERTHGTVDKDRKSTVGLWLGMAGLLVLVVAGGLVGGRLLAPSPAIVAQPELKQPSLPPTVAPAVATPTVTPPTTAVVTTSPAPAPAPAPTQPAAAAARPAVTAATPAPHKATAPPRPAPSVAAVAAPTSAQRLSQLLAKGNASLAGKDYAQAGKLAAEALTLDPQNADALALKKKAQDGAWSQVQIQ